MIFAQHGPAWKPKIDLFLSKNIINGIIWDPREDRIDRIKEIRSNNQSYEKVYNLIDLKVYYKQFTGSITKNLDDLSYFPSQAIDRSYLRDTDNIRELVESSVEFQLDFGVDMLLSPSLYLYSFNERYVDKLLDMWEEFHEYIESKEYPSKKYVSIIFSESALENKLYMSDFLNDFSDISDSFDGIYITVDRINDNNKVRHDFNSSKLQNMLQLIYDLKNMGLEVIVGYTGIESILYSAVGADAIGTGWFHSLRRFNKEQKGLEPSEQMGRQKKRYTSMSMLYELPIEDTLFAMSEDTKDELYPVILDKCELDQKIYSGDIDDINLNDTFQQYIESLGSVIEHIDSIYDESEKLQYIESILHDAEANIETYNTRIPSSLKRLNKAHIENYKQALALFREENFL